LTLEKEEMYPKKPSAKQSIDLLLHAAIDLDQLILLEAESIQDSLEAGKGNVHSVQVSLDKIKSYREENSKKVREARNILREME
jgi:hypothetical protein